jgi:hypothetical protein
MWKLNSCPRCESDIFVYQDVSGNYYEECFRCCYQNKVEENIIEDSLGQVEGSAQSRK